MRKVTLKELVLLSSFIVKVDRTQSLYVQAAVLTIGSGVWGNVMGDAKRKVRDSKSIKYLCFRDKKLTWMGNSFKEGALEEKTRTFLEVESGRLEEVELI